MYGEANVVRTLVIDGVANREYTENGGKDRSSGRVLSREVPGLQSSKACLRSWSLGELRVKVDQGSEASSGPSRLCRRKKCCQRNVPAGSSRSVREEWGRQSLVGRYPQVGGERERAA